MSLRNKILFYLVLPVFLVMVTVAGINLWRGHGRMLEQQIQFIEKELHMASQELERSNLEAVSVARTMAIAQMNGLFGAREQTLMFCRRILQTNTQFTGAYVGYEPNADRRDASEVNTTPNEFPWTDGQGRFLPYWYRDVTNNGFLNLEALTGVDDPDNLYYRGMKEKFRKGAKEDYIIGEPHLYNDTNLIVEHTSPIYIGRKFLGVAGIDRSLNYLNEFLIKIKPYKTAQLYVISGRGNVVASTLDEEIRTISIDDFYVNPDGKVLTDIFAWESRSGMQVLDQEKKSLATKEGVSGTYRELFRKYYLLKQTTPVEPFMDPLTQEKGFIACAYIPTGEWRLVMTVSRSEIVEETKDSLILASAIGGLGMLTVVCVIVIFSNRLTGRILNSNRLAQRVAKGDLTSEVKVESEDETGQLQEAIRDMITSLNTLIFLVKQSTIQLVSTATRISGAAKDQEDTIEEFGLSTNQIATAVNQISITSKELLGTMGNVADSAGETAKLADSGRHQLMNMETSMSHLFSASESISDKLAVIKEKTGNINKVVSTINSVSEQTNLLSLNAAIEAEKAGEYGLGFAVVAREIRRLSNQTGQATVDIENMVREMQSAVSAGVMEMDKFAEGVRSGVSEVNQLGDYLETIITKVQDLTPRFDHVKEGMRSQTQGAEQIASAMSQLQEGVKRTSMSLKEFDQATQALNRAVHGLRGEVSRFKVNEKSTTLPFLGKVRKKKENRKD